jgi:cytoskeletal protein RodZ
LAWGKTLRERREQLGYTLEFVEEETKIRKYYLEALENDHFSLLPPKIYASGFVKQYARILELDEKQIVDEFRRLAYGDGEDDDKIVLDQTVSHKEKPRFQPQNLVLALVFLVLVVWLGNYLVDYFAQEGTRHSGPGISQQEPQTGLKDSDKIIKETPIIKTARVEIEVKQKCWILVKVDNETAYTGTLQAGENRVFEGKQSVYIKAGNAGGLEITFNDNKEGRMGMPGEVKEREFPAPGRQDKQE